MALPHLIKYIYNTGTDEVIRRGKKIHAFGYVELMENDALMNDITFRVRDDSYTTFYKVHIQKYNDAKTLMLRCSCPYNLGDICRHEAAALFQLQDLVDKNLLGSHEAIVYKQKHTIAKMKYIDLKTVRMLAGLNNYAIAEEIQRGTKANIVKATNEKVEATLEYNAEKNKLVIQKNEEKNFDTSCTCDEKEHALCAHKTALFLQMLNSYGPHYFDSIRNWDKEKNKLLEAYGYNLAEDLKGKFEFAYKEGKPFLRVMDPSIKRLAPASNARPVVAMVKEETVETETISTTQKIGIVFNTNERSFPLFSIDVIQGEADEEAKKFISNVAKADLTKFINTDIFSEQDKQLLQQVRKIQSSEVNKYLDRNSPFSGFWENIIHDEKDALPEETKALMVEYLHPKLKKIFEENSSNPLVFYLPPGTNFKTENLKEVSLSTEALSPVFKIAAKNGHYELSCAVKIDGQATQLTKNEWGSSLLFLYNHTFYQWQKPEDVLNAEKYFNKPVILSKNNWAEQYRQIVLPLTKEYKVEFDKSLIKEIKEGDPEVRLMLIEKGEYLMFQPLFSYKGFETKANDKEVIIIPEGEKVLLVHRNKEAENKFISKLEGLHSLFVRPPDGNSLVLKGTDVLKNNWFFLFVDAMKELKVPVHGFEALKNFRFNTAKPSTHIHVSSGLDWFDAKVELAFGDQRIGIIDIKKALANKQSFVQLSDGTLGILPDEWIKKYSLLFKVGEGKSNQLRLSKFHLSVIDDLYEKRDEKELSFELDAKYERLRNYKSIPEINVPDGLQDILRPYQTSGYHWLNYLNDVGWGGILADDMGLGKTVQALTMLRHYKEAHGALKAMVVCPTTLIYNWENEIKKFTPQLTYRIHHGSIRTRDTEELEQSNIIITTYGTLRSDIQVLSKTFFDYIILDESQAIKNPGSKVAKAACLLIAKNRLCMSGTPLQNNTFDIFAQMNFLNPGLLGTMEFFRNEFATPIDKFGEQEQKDHLRKLLYPFILRRTK
nr:SNF2 helicase associated domain-containing protein [Chitinophagaceae bacterium]